MKTIEELEKEITKLQKPIQYQFMAIEQMLLYQKENMSKELWQPYIRAVQIHLNNCLKELQRK